VVSGGLDFGEVSDESPIRSNRHGAELGESVRCDGLLGHLLHRGLSCAAGTIGAACAPVAVTGRCETTTFGRCAKGTATYGVSFFSVMGGSLCQACPPNKSGRLARDSC